MSEGTTHHLVTVRLRRGPCKDWYHVVVVGGAYDGLRLILKSEPSESRRWSAVAKYEAMIEVKVDTERLEAGVECSELPSD